MQAAAVLTSAAMPLRQRSVPHCREEKASVFDSITTPGRARKDV
jgi:hypothetical protein